MAEKKVFETVLLFFSLSVNDKNEMALIAIFESKCHTNSNADMCNEKLATIFLIVPRMILLHLSPCEIGPILLFMWKNSGLKSYLAAKRFFFVAVTWRALR